MTVVRQHNPNKIERAGAAADMIARWEGVAHTATRGLYAPGWEHDDLLQEARLGLVQAYALWDHERPFGPLAYSIARRRVLEVVRSETREKRAERPLSLDYVYSEHDGTVVTLVERVAAPDTLEDRIRLRGLLKALDRLTVAERRAVVGVAVGVSYEEMGRSRKHLDNAVQRGRAKLREAA